MEKIGSAIDKSVNLIDIEMVWFGRLPVKSCLRKSALYLTSGEAKEKVKWKLGLMRMHRALSQFGIDPLRFLRALLAMPAFFRDYRHFRREYRGLFCVSPQLHDRYAEAGATKSEYFWQDLIVARWIHEAKPERHIDVGSRTDGFVAHIASFREIEVFDVRPITTTIPGISFRQADLMDTAALSAWQGDRAGGGTAIGANLSVTGG